MSLVKGGEIPKPKTKHANLSKLIMDKQEQQKQLRQQVKSKVENLAAEIVHEYIQRKPFRANKGDFAQFPSNELYKVRHMIKITTWWYVLIFYFLQAMH